MRRHSMFTIFMHLNATKEWLALSPNQREQFVEHDLTPILARCPAVQITFYDVEAFSAQCSDIATFETNNLDDYAALIDELRNTSMYTVLTSMLSVSFPLKLPHLYKQCSNPTTPPAARCEGGFCQARGQSQPPQAQQK